MDMDFARAPDLTRLLKTGSFLFINLIKFLVCFSYLILYLISPF